MTKKVFVSHASTDGAYANVFVKLLRTFGFREEDIFCSSNYPTGVAYGERIFERLKMELASSPVVIYLLSNDYYKSVVCLNEMGASWVISNDHYPVVLPGFEVSEIKGAVSSDRLSLVAGNYFEREDLFRFIERISLSSNVQWPENVRLMAVEYIEPLKEELNYVISEKNALAPKNDFFETVLGDERPLIGPYKDRACCYKLPKKILPKHLETEDEEIEDSQFLFVWKDQGEFKSGDKVQFRIKNSNQKRFSDIGLCRNIYVKSIKKIQD